METIDEGSEFTVRFDSWSDAAKTIPVAPSTASYSVVDKDSGTVIRAATSLTPSSAMSVVFTAADNVILNSANKTEERVCVLKTTGCNFNYAWRVRNLTGVP